MESWDLTILIFTTARIEGERIHSYPLITSVSRIRIEFKGDQQPSMFIGLTDGNPRSSEVGRLSS